MDQPLFSDSQFLDQNALNTAFGLSYSSTQQVTDLTNSPGLINPSSLVITPATLNINVSAPSPFAVLFGNGALATANGTTNGVISSSYSVNMAPVVPGSGSVTAYVVASFAQVQETPYEVIGPPAGHPDYNPSFAAYQAYSDVKDTLAITATTTAPDNLTTFEICRTTLTAGQTSITTVDTTHRVLASSLLAPTGVNAGSYAGATVTVGVDGRITGIASVAYGPLAGTNTWTATNTFEEGIDITGEDASGAHVRAVNGNYGVMLQNNATGFFLLQTASGNQNGGDNGWRPLSWNFATGFLTLDGTGRGASFGGALTVDGLLTADAGVTVTGGITASVSISSPDYTTASSTLLFTGGSTNSIFNNHANTANNFIIADNGNATVRGVTFATGGFQIGATSNPIASFTNGLQSLSDGSTQINNTGAKPPLSLGVNSTAQALLNLFFNAVGVGSIGTTGTSVAYNTTSDYRLKVTFGFAEVGDIIDAVPVHDGAFLADPKRRRRPMFLAHELALAMPAAVTGEKDAVDEAGKIIPQQVDHPMLVPVLWAEIQSLRKRLAALEGRQP